MTTGVTLYKGGISLGTAEATNASTALSSYSGTAINVGKNVEIVVTDGGTFDGLRHKTRIIANDGAGNLTMSGDFPYPTA